ncbi:TonB-dependent siderophore receptor [Steroidobacter flavus]|uniref:TonB-dependent siderophore receptor n=1 Tax=Steroidobacter flavus TaxID=1842136 RepID=A0ABV8T5M7_9GAMM
MFTGNLHAARGSRLAGLLLAITLPLSAMAAPVSVKVDPQPLGTALNVLAEQLGLQLVYDGALVANLKAPALSGKMEPAEALQRILTGSGLTYRFTSASAVTLEKSTAERSTRKLGPVRVEGVNTPVAGINGSTDLTATEGTGSYTSSALAIASKTPQSIKDTPQSVSVITQQQMQDQNLTDFTSMMNRAPGVSMIVGGNGPGEPTFYSRGFAIQRLLIDGGAPIDIGGASPDIGSATSEAYRLIPQIDMALYDHVEILRGADGLFNGYGDPGGVINLTRKRPLNHSQVIVEGLIGSWSNYRTMIDVSAPLGFDGKLRGRGVLVWQDQDYFYDLANSNKTLAYGVLETDITESTTLSAGFSITRQHSLPARNGLPRYQNGEDLGLARSTCLCFSWSREDMDTTEVFARLEQDLGEHWSLKLNLTDIDQQRSFKLGTVAGPVNPVTLAGPTMSAAMGDRASAQQSADLTLDGSVELFGHRQQLVAGMNYAKVDGGGYQNYADVLGNNVASPAVNVLDFHPESYLEPGSVPAFQRYPEYGTEQWGAYSNLRLTFWRPLHINLGLRYSHYEAQGTNQTLCRAAANCPGRNVGDVTRSTSIGYSTHNMSWPPGWSLSYDITDTLTAYGSYTDIYNEQSTYMDPSGSAIDPVTGSNFEGGLKWAPRDGRLNASLSIYRLKQEDFAWKLTGHPLTGTAPDGMHQCCYTTEADVTSLSQGADLEVSGELLPGWQLSAGYTYNKNEYKGRDVGTRAGQPLVSRLPRQLLKLWSSYQFQGGEWLQRLSLGLGVNAQTEGFYAGTVCVLYRTNAAGNVVCDTANGGQLPYSFTQGGYAVFAARAAYRIDSRWSAALNVDNLTDRTYYQTIGRSDAGNWYGEPRSFTLTLRGSF